MSAQDADVAPPGQDRPMEILLVEDNEGDVLLASEAFKTLRVPYTLSVASDGEQALAMLHRAEPYQDQPRPDFILLDLNLPKRDGREVLETIKRDPDLRGIPVVVLSGSRAEEEIAHSYALYANAYIVKPVHFDRFKEIVSAIEAFFFSVVALQRSAG